MERKLTRRELWVSLWLTRLLGFLSLFAGKTPALICRRWFKRKLDRLTKSVLQSILIRAALRGNRGAKRGGMHLSRDPRHNLTVPMRAMLGGDLRRLMKARGIRARIAKIRAVLDDLDAHVTRLLRRLLHGMSRRVSAFTRAALLPFSPALMLQHIKPLALAAVARFSDTP
ncbi:MAG: hypothetical protein ABWZ40_01840 [Caulobacterales bacterium]